MYVCFLLPPILCTDSRTWQFSSYICSEHWHNPSDMPMNVPKRDNSICQPLMCLFPPNTNTFIERKKNDCNWHTCMTFSRLCCWNPAVFTVAVTQHWFRIRFVSCVPLQHTLFWCHSFVYPFSTPFTVQRTIFYGLFCYTLFIYATPKSKSAENVCYRQLAFDRCRACALFTASETFAYVFQSTTKCFFLYVKIYIRILQQSSNSVSYIIKFTRDNKKRRKFNFKQRQI